MWILLMASSYWLLIIEYSTTATATAPGSGFTSIFNIHCRYSIFHFPADSIRYSFTANCYCLPMPSGPTAFSWFLVLGSWFYSFFPLPSSLFPLPSSFFLLSPPHSPLTTHHSPSFNASALLSAPFFSLFPIHIPAIRPSVFLFFLFRCTRWRGR